MKKTFLLPLFTLVFFVFSCSLFNKSVDNSNTNSSTITPTPSVTASASPTASPSPSEKPELGRNFLAFGAQLLLKKLQKQVLVIVQLEC